MSEPLLPGKLLIYNRDPAVPSLTALGPAGNHAERVSAPKDLIGLVRKYPRSVTIISVQPDEVKLTVALVQALRKNLGSAYPLAVMDGGLHPAVAQLFTRDTQEPVRAASSLSSWIQTWNAQMGWGPVAARVVEKDEWESLPLAVRWTFERLAPQLAYLMPAATFEDSMVVQVERLSQLLTPIQEPFLQFIHVVRPPTDGQAYDLPRAIRIYGVDMARTLVAADRFLDSTRGEGLRWDKVTLRPLEPVDSFTRYAALAKTHFGEDRRFGPTAYTTGLVLDAVALLCAGRDTAAPALRELAEGFPVALTRTTQTISTGKEVQNLPLAGLIVSVHLLELAGRVVLMACDPGYVESLRAWRAKKVSPRILDLAEKERFGISSLSMASLIAGTLPLLRESALALRALNDPYLLEARPGLEPVASLARVCHQARPALA